MLFRSTVVAALAALPVVLAQTYTDCDPTKKTCSADPGLETTSFTSDFTQGESALTGFTAAAGTSLTYGSNGAEFTIAKEGNAPTIESDFTFFFGTLEVVMQAAPGTGIVSSIVLESADLDEVDWEFIGSDYAHVQSNYYGKGNTTSYDRVVYHALANPQKGFHTYKLDWSKDRIIYYIDGAAVRTLNYADANGGSNFPQTPMRVKLGNWSGGNPDSPEGTATWAGGRTDYSQAPFTMYVKSVKVTNTNPAKQYVWTDMTGSYESIKVVAGDGKNSFLSSATSVSTAASSTVASATKSRVSTSSSSAATATITNKPVLRPNTNSTTSANQTTTHTTVTTSSSTGSSSATRTTSSSIAVATTNAASSFTPALSGFALLFTLGMSALML